MKVIIASPQDPKEWTIIELQGSLEMTAGHDKLDGLELGKLTEKDGKATLIIGKHELEGKLTPLDKPLAVMEKQLPKAGETEPSYTVVGIIRKKYLFKNRPKPILK